ncbi:MAG: nickel pincer cofactor biosynthesis protein LarB [Longimicrobiales bacterium]
MNAEQVLAVLEAVAVGRASPQAALDQLAWLPIEPIREAQDESESARLDHHRALRVGHPEVVFGQGKTIAQILAICERLAVRDNAFLATRVSADARAALKTRFPASAVNEPGRVVHLRDPSVGPPSDFGTVLIASAGTADLPVAEEAAACAQAFGNPVIRMYDVGVAGLHRILQEAETLRSAAIVIVVAGLEGALPSVVGGLVRVPVIAVPTSVGYGASFGGLAALLAMLNSCASGVTVVNIDNGFGAACAATRINQLLARAPGG